jgi:hypothetical protein
MTGMRLAGGMRRVLAALLALALLALPGAPMRHAAAAPPDHAGHAAVQAAPCPGHMAAEAIRPAAHHEDGGQPCDRDGSLPGLACCVAGLCAGLQGAPLPALVAPPLPPRAAPRLAAAPPGRRGLDIPPALKPPRAA